MSRGFIKLLVAFVFGALSLVPVVGIVFAVLACIWVAWAILLIVSGLVAYIKDIRDNPVTSD